MCIRDRCWTQYTECWLQDGDRVLAIAWTEGTDCRMYTEYWLQDVHGVLATVWTQSTDYRVDVEYWLLYGRQYIEFWLQH